MTRLALLTIPVTAFVLGGFTIFVAGTVARRAAMVEPNPSQLTAEQLIEHGPPENRHVRIKECWLADEYVCHTSEGDEQWSYVLLPIYPARVAKPCQGEHVRIVARITGVGGPQELQDFLARHKNEVTGCIWDDFLAAGPYGPLLRDAYPRLKDGAYVVVSLNGELPTPTKARYMLLLGLVFVSVGIITLGWIVWSWVRARRRDVPHEWLASSHEDPSPVDDGASHLAHFDRPAFLGPRLRAGAILASTVSLPAMGVLYLMENAGLIPEPFGTRLAALALLLFLVASIYYSWSNRLFVEQVYETLEPRDLPSSARKYFDEQTPQWEQQGFVLLGDFSVIDSFRVSVRLLLSRDQTCLVTLESTRWMTAYNVMSVSPDGTLLHSVSIDLERNPQSPLPSKCLWVRTGDIVLALAQHHRLVDAWLRDEAFSECLIIEPQYVLGLMDYAHRISAWSLRERGITRRRLPPIPRADQIVRLEDGRPIFAWQARPHDRMFASEAIAALRAPQTEVEAHATAPEAVLSSSASEGSWR